MCLGVPGRIEAIIDEGELTRAGRVNFGGIIKEVNLSCVPDAKVGDYVIVHVGFAIAVIDEGEAGKVFEYLEKLGELNELETPAASESAVNR